MQVLARLYYWFRFRWYSWLWVTCWRTQRSRNLHETSANGPLVRHHETSVCSTIAFFLCSWIHFMTLCAYPWDIVIHDQAADAFTNPSQRASFAFHRHNARWWPQLDLNTVEVDLWGVLIKSYWTHYFQCAQIIFHFCRNISLLLAFVDVLSIRHLFAIYDFLKKIFHPACSFVFVFKRIDYLDFLLATH